MKANVKQRTLVNEKRMERTKIWNNCTELVFSTPSNARSVVEREKKRKIKHKS